ncbi:MAG: alpha/beta hydrolase [Gammaproteobacteria bacterium]|nr:alpha/beta hydrolase [Gammaproteobacteria bacterium]
MKSKYVLKKWFAGLVVVALALSACIHPSSAPMAERTTGSVVSADGVEIKYEVSGQGQPALVFVHCWTCNRSFWDDQVAYFAPRYTVVRLDLAGHGESGGGRKNYTMTAFGADVAAVVEKLKLPRVILIGHSMGGPVSVEASSRLGARVIGVVGVDTFYTGWQPPKGDQVAAFIKPFATDFSVTTDKFVRSMFMPDADKARVDRIAKIMTSADKAMAVSAMTDILQWYEQDSENSLKRLGNKLRNINADPKRENHAHHKSVVLIPGAGHFVPQEKPLEFNRALDVVAEQLIQQTKTN